MAERESTAENATTRRSLPAVRFATPPVIDGDLSDPGWRNAAKVESFVEGVPGDNIPAKIKTIAYLTYDDRYFYLGYCYDRQSFYDYKKRFSGSECLDWQTMRYRSFESRD